MAHHLSAGHLGCAAPTGLPYAQPTLETIMDSSSQQNPNDPTDLPDPGPGKQDPEELDKQLDRALEDSMDASDPPATIMPEVHHRDEGGAGDELRPAAKKPNR
jgi:hypothetical protein